MQPGSGPADRDNDVYFQPIREHLLAHEIAVCSFDKRGVRRSTGCWQDAGIAEQAGDVLACIVSLLDDDAVAKPVGLFGHSQGGWVVIEAAGQRPEIAFVVTSSAPGVTPAMQERYSHSRYLLAHGVRADELDAALVPFDQLIERLRQGAAFDDVRPLLDRRRLPEPYRRLELTLFPDDEKLWSFFNVSPISTLRLRSRESPCRCWRHSAATMRSCRSRTACGHFATPCGPACSPSLSFRAPLTALPMPPATSKL
jgi:pimeloyl-ACP methyl ester carboxylesterase